MQADLIILGAGPAGMAATARAAGLGLSVLLLDEQLYAGGQIYRDVGRNNSAKTAILGTDYADGNRLVAALNHPRVTHLAGATVWQIDPSGEVAFSRGGGAEVAQGKRVLIANGALERAMPIPGWTLPGVMAAGAAQILLKSANMVPERAVLAGSGPLLYLIAAQMVRAGVPPLALVETQSTSDFLRGLRHLPGALIGWRYLWKGAGLLATLRKAGVRRFKGATRLEVLGQDHAQSIRFFHAGEYHRIACDTVLLHQGVTPNTQATRSLRLPHVWDHRQRAFRPVGDVWGQTEIQNIFVAGDGAGIGGASSAKLGGEIAALEIAHSLGHLPTGDRDLAARPLRFRLRLDRAIRPFLDTMFPPYAGALAPADTTIICRCEDVTAGDIRHYAALGCLGPNQTKAFGRAGMGPCQGRYCGLTVTELLAAHHDLPQAQIGAYRIRAPLKPVTLAEIAGLDEESLISAPH